MVSIFTEDLSRWLPRTHFTSPRTNHFLDGNKRTALNAAIAFLGLNGFDVIDPDGKLFAAMIGISSGEWTKLQMATLLEQLASPWRDHD
jgi:death-on-curing protein